MISRAMQWLLLLALVAADQAIKAAARALPTGKQIALLPFIIFTHLRNTGGVWGLGEGLNWLFIALSIAAIALLIYMRYSFIGAQRILLLCILAGIAGNLIDRLLFGAVIDWLAIGWWPTFNLADALLNVGVAGIILIAAWHVVRDRTRAQKSSSSLSSSSAPLRRR